MKFEAQFRDATHDDLAAIVQLLADDPLGQAREISTTPIAAEYVNAFSRMGSQSDNRMIVALVNERVVGCLQLTIIEGLSRLGMRRAQIESVRIDPAYRSRGLGKQLLKHARDIAQRRQCGLVQLTTDISRPLARRFYERAGFKASHYGMKLLLD